MPARSRQRDERGRMDNGWTGAGGTARRPGSTAGEDDEGASTPRASGGPAIPAPAAGRGASEDPRGRPGEPGPGTAGRDAPAPPQERGSTGPGNVMRPCSDRQQNRAAEEARRITRSMINNTASSSLSRDPDRSAGSTKSAGRNVPAPPQERDFTGPGNVMIPCSDRQQNGAAEEARRITRGMINNTASSSLSREPDMSAGSTESAGRNAPAPPQERDSTGPGNVMRPCSDRQQNGAAEEARRITRSMINNTASSSLSRDPDMSAGSTKRAGDHTSESVSSSSKKRKRMSARSYVKRFKIVEGENAADVVVASPDRVGKENSSSGHVADSNISELCEGSMSTEKNKRHEVSKSLVFGLHETSETRVNQCSAPFSEVQPHKPTDMCQQNIVAESSLPVKARDRPCALARQSCLSPLQSAPASLIHHEEIKSTFGDSETISVQNKDSASGHVVMPFDETDGNSNMCVACGTPGILRFCDGKACQNRYHISCLDPSLEYLSPGIWFCTSCTKKRFQFGLHSIVDGIESVWDVREAEGMQNSKQYFVKYKNLAHVHNCWVPEGDINVMPGGADLLSLFKKRNHTEKAIWKAEWSKPHRLLRKRLLMPPKLADDFFSSSGVEYSCCNLEWLVKWRGLGYVHATWELETLPCLCTSEADELKKNYENRHEAAKQSSIPSKEKVKQSSFQKLQSLPDGCHPDFDNDHLCCTNHLREFWYKSCGAVLVDDKEFVAKTILFTMSILPDVSQPILIVTTPASLSLWEAQFNNLAPFINVVVYDGGKDNLKLIQDLEFYESGSCIMLQVLLSHADAILEDIEPISRIGWEAVIVDYYQKSTLQYLEQLKQLSTDFRMLLVSSPIEDNLPEYVKLLGFLSSGEQEDDHCVDTAEALVISEVSLKRYIAYERRADSLKILEHWVPAYISQLQLQIYCSILLSNSSVLQSKMKSDSSLCNIIMSLSKCCDHPYLVDEFLSNSSANNNDRTDTIDTRIQACGKLLLLQKMLKEIRKRRLRVIILFQSGLAGGNSMGDILEGVLYERFGPESYERVESGAPLAEKDAAVNLFNDNTKGRFFFLIESRACLPSIKLSSVDAIIIYNSDCNPLNDLKALQRIKMESQFKYPAIFRLYTPFTMEEKQLVLAKHGVLIDNYKDMAHSSVHSLISWGASFLFTRLDELQHDNHASKSFESDTDFMDKVILEFLKKLATNVEDSTDINCTSISKANMSGEFYSRNITLIGESVAMPALDGDPSIFWLNLLDGKSPCWDNISKPAQSSHRMLQNIDEPAKVPAKESEEAGRKRRKVDKITISSSKHSSDNNHDDMLPKNCTALGPPFQQLDDTKQKEGMKKLMTTPKNLHVQLKQELSKLLKVLQLPDNVRIMAKQIFEYSLNNHLVLPEPVGILHAFNIALCWHAASLLNYKVDRRESLAIAEKGFNCEYNEALAGLIYNKLRALKEKVPNRAGETNINCQPVPVEVTHLSWQETCTNSVNDHIFQNKEMDLHGNFTNGAPQEVSSVAEQMTSEEQEPVQETRKEWHVPNDEPPNMIVEKSIDLVDNVFYLREKNILCKQQLEISGLVTHRQNNVIRLKEVCSIVLEHIRRSHIDEMTRSEKIKLTAQWFTMLTFAFLEHMKLQHDKLELLQFDTWSSERILKEKLHQVAKSGELDLDFDRASALPDSKFVMEEFIHFKGHSDEYCVAENEPVETSMGSGGGLASEAVDFQHNILCSSDGIGVQRAGCSSSTIPANDGSTGQESSTSECRNTEHMEIYNTAKSIMLLGASAHNDDTLYTDRVQMESPNLASLQSLVALVGTQADLSCMSPQKSTDLSAQQNVAPSRCPPAEGEHTGLSGTHAVQVMQLEMQRSVLCLDASPQKTHPNDRSQECCQPHKVTGMSEGGATTSHHLGDVRMQVQENDDGNVAADLVFPESPTYPARSPVTLEVSMEDESQICKPSMAAKQSTSPPAQQNPAISLCPPAAAEPSGTKSTKAAWDLQPGEQPSISMQDQPTEADRAGMLDSIAAQDLQLEMLSSTSAQDVPFEKAYVSGIPVLQSPEVLHCVGLSLDPHTGAESAGIVPAEQSTSLPAQQTLGTSQHRPAEAEQPGILGTEPACDLQPKVQPSTSVQDEPSEAEDEPEVEDEAEMGYEPAEAERAGILVAIAAQEMQSSTSTQVVPFERTYVSGMSVLQSPTIHQRVEPSLDPHAGVESAGTVTTHDLQSEILPSASVPTEQSTNLPAELSLGTSRHSPAESESADILGTKAACHLQLSQGEVQTSATMQDQPAEGQACILGDIAARSLQPETQPSTSTRSAPFERSYLVGMPVLQNHSVEPSLDPHARAESTQTSGSLIAHHLQYEVQPSASMQDQPAEAEGAVMLGSTAAQDLQPELQSSTTFQHVPLERTHIEERRQIGFQQNIVPGPEQPTEHPPVTMLVFNNPILSDEPLKNELDRLMQCGNVLRKDHEHKKSLLLIEHNQEIEKVNKKYGSLLQKEDSTYLQTQRELADIYKKVFVNKALAKNFRGEFTPSPAAQGRSTSPVMQQPCESSSAAQTAAAPVISSSAIRPQVYNPPGSHVRPSFLSQQSSSSQPQTILPGNLYRTTSSPSVPVPVPDGSYGSGGALSCAVQPQSSLPSNLHGTVPPIPPPHLPHASYGSAEAQLCASPPPVQQLTMPPPYAIRTDQQQLPASTAVTSLEQCAPVITGSYTSTVPPGVAVLNSIDPSSAHQTMLPSASSSCLPRRTPSLPPSGRHLAGSIVNYLRSSNSNPIFMPDHEQSSYPSMVLGSTTSGLPNAATGSQQHAGAQIAGVNHNESGSESASLGPYMPARFGLGSISGSPAGAGTASTEVVCLSDDE